jgi:FKBP-type peptidyl-prolyl cis-trans isomerase
MGSFNKFEATGIFMSIGIMVLALVLIRAKVDNQTQIGLIPDAQEGAVVVATQGEDGKVSNEELRNALTNAASVDGELQKLVIDDVRIGSGETTVKVGDTVVVDYIGSTQEGVQFDSSYARGTPFIFTVGGGKVIQGWEKGLIGMKVGGQRILIIPSALGYGNMQVGTIPPNSTLVFAIELREIQ